MILRNQAFLGLSWDFLIRPQVNPFLDGDFQFKFYFIGEEIPKSACRFDEGTITKKFCLLSQVFNRHLKWCNRYLVHQLPEFNAAEVSINKFFASYLMINPVSIYVPWFYLVFPNVAMRSKRNLVQN